MEQKSKDGNLNYNRGEGIVSPKSEPLPVDSPSAGSVSADEFIGQPFCSACGSMKAPKRIHMGSSSEADVYECPDCFNRSGDGFC